MTRTIRLVIVVFAPLLWSSAVAALDIDSAKALYAAASYEEALDVLNATDEGDADLVDQYKALCFLALDRLGDAEASLERIVQRSPLYKIDATTVSPKIVELYEQVRQRTLPTTARRLYGEAKQQYDRGQFRDARGQFVELLNVVKEATAVGAAESVEDLAQLGEGFLALTEAELARRERPEPPPAPPVAPPAPAVRVIYSAADQDVVPPVQIERTLPTWAPPTGPFERLVRRGVLSVVIDEQGTVESANLDQAISPFYDRDLLAATSRWRYRPAVKDGVPVKYQLRIEIVLRPPGP